MEMEPDWTGHRFKKKTQNKTNKVKVIDSLLSDYLITEKIFIPLEYF